MKSRIVIEPCTGNALGPVIELFDNEFIFRRGRLKSLRDRYNNIFSNISGASIWAAWEGDRPLSGLVVRPFEWCTADRIWYGAMIGMVCTAPQEQGKGLSTMLFNEVQDYLRRLKIDFGILWTTIPQFYQRLGWVHTGLDVFGEVLSEDFQEGNNLDLRIIDNIAVINGMHERYCKQRVLRRASDYHVLPPAVDEVVVFFPRDSSLSCAYALVGKKGQIGYVYEIVGENNEDISIIWGKVRQSFSKIFINDKPDSISFKWLTTNEIISWKNQMHTMWLSPSHSIVPWSEWNMSFFDRI